MVVNGVNFIEREIKKLTEKEFIRQCIDVHWLSESKDTRKKRLQFVYRKVNGGGED